MDEDLPFVTGETNSVQAEGAYIPESGASMPDTRISTVGSNAPGVPVSSLKTPQQPRHKAYIPSPFSPMPNYQDMSDEQLKVMRSSGLFKELDNLRS